MLTCSGWTDLLPQEFWLVTTIVVGLLVPSVLVNALGGYALHQAVVALVVLGGLLGVPPAIMYHWRLAQVLRRRGALPKRWIWNPTALHPHLREPERARVLPWFVAGVAGFALTVLGALTLMLAVVGAALRSSSG